MFGRGLLAMTLLIALTGSPVRSAESKETAVDELDFVFKVSTFVKSSAMYAPELKANSDEIKPEIED